MLESCPNFYKIFASECLKCRENAYEGRILSCDCSLLPPLRQAVASFTLWEVSVDLVQQLLMRVFVVGVIVEAGVVGLFHWFCHLRLFQGLGDSGELELLGAWVLLSMFFRLFWRLNFLLFVFFLLILFSWYKAGAHLLILKILLNLFQSIANILKLLHKSRRLILGLQLHLDPIGHFPLDNNNLIFLFFIIGVTSC